MGGELPKEYYHAMDPFVTLTAAAVATKTLKVGTGICLVNQRDPIQTAKEVATIDQVSDRRFLFGIGIGWNQDEMENHGSVSTRVPSWCVEHIEAMKEIWTKEEGRVSRRIRQFRSGLRHGRSRCRSHIRRFSLAVGFRTRHGVPPAMAMPGRR